VSRTARQKEEVLACMKTTSVPFNTTHLHTHRHMHALTIGLIVVLAELTVARLWY